MIVKQTTPAKRELAPAQVQAVTELFAVLAEPTRLRILQMLEAAPASVRQIVDSLSIKQANASKQLGVLHQAGVVARRKEGSTVFYSIRMPLVFDLCALVCDGLRAEAEARAEALRGR